MPKVLIFCFCVLVSVIARAQDSLPPTCVKIAPLGLLWKMHLDIEQVVSKTISVGFNMHYYYDRPVFANDLSTVYDYYNTFKIDGYCRIYFKQNAPTGWYFAPFIGYGSYSSRDYSRGYFRGGGASLGSQQKIGHSNYLYDVSLAIQVYSVYHTSNKTWGLDEWENSLQNNMVAPRLSLGLVF